MISNCVFGWDEIAADVSVRQRDKALALIDKHFGSHRAAAVRSDTLEETFA